MTPVPPTHEPAAFISYSRNDSEFALGLARDLKAAGARVWLDQLDIDAGHEWDDAIEAALIEAPQMLLILSPSSASSRNVRNEIALALDEGKIIIPILHRDCVVPLQLRRVQHVDFRTDYAQGLKSLLKHMQIQATGHVGSAVPAVLEAVPPAPPVASQPVKSSPPIVPQPAKPRPPAAVELHQQSAHPPEHWAKRRMRQIFVLIPLVGILAVLMMSDLGDFMGYSPFGSNDCSLADTSQSSISAKMYMPIAKWALRYTPTPSVAIIYIDPAHDPADLLTDVCASRAFLGRLVTDLNGLGAHVIVIDKYYSATACAEKAKNAAFIKAMEASNIPVVVGQADHALTDAPKGSGCLAPTPRIEFNPASKVHYGLVRIDNDDLKIPLRWPLFTDPAQSGATPAPASQQLPASSGDTLSLVAAKIVSPNIESNRKVQKLLAKQDDPYTTFLNLPNITALTAMCSAEPSPRADIDGQPGDELCKPWVRDLDNLNGKQLSLTGKIVVIGDLSGQDMKPFPSDLAPFPAGQRPGVFLQANYVQALLDHRFLLEIPMAVTLSLLVGYVLVVYCLYWAHDEQGQPRLTNEQAGLWSLAVLAVLLLVSFLALVTMSYFTPLWALWGGGVFMVFRYLEALGHHRSQHLLGHLAGHHHAAEAPHSAGDEPDHTN
jgi:CHASE2 domain-containing sensor protein